MSRSRTYVSLRTVYALPRSARIDSVMSPPESISSSRGSAQPTFRNSWRPSSRRLANNASGCSVALSNGAPWTAYRQQLDLMNSAAERFSCQCDFALRWEARNVVKSTPR